MVVVVVLLQSYAFSALTQWAWEEHPTCKSRAMWCWCGYLSGARCRLSAYGPADDAASPTPPSLASFKSRLVLPAYPGCPGKAAVVVVLLQSYDQE